MNAVGHARPEDCLYQFKSVKSGFNFSPEDMISRIRIYLILRILPCGRNKHRWTCTPRRAAGSWSPCIRYSDRERRMKSRNETPFRPAPPRLRCCRGHPVFSRQYASTDYHSRAENDYESPPGWLTNCSGISSFVQSIRNNWFGLTYLL